MISRSIFCVDERMKPSASGRSFSTASRRSAVTSSGAIAATSATKSTRSATKAPIVPASTASDTAAGDAWVSDTDAGDSSASDTGASAGWPLPAGRPGTGISESGTLHRIEEVFLRKEVEAAGFRFVAEGDFMRNPADARDKNTPDPPQPKDEFVLKFVKP